MSGSTEDLLRELSANVKPVRRIAPLRASAGIVLGLWALAVLAEWHMGGGRPVFGELGRWDEVAYSGLFAGLVAAATAGLVAALAHRTPGRDPLVRRASLIAAGGAALAIVSVAANWMIAGPGPMPGAAMAWSCVMRSVTLAVLPVIAAGLLLRGSWRAGGGMWVPLFAVPLGAIAVHANCVAGGAAHMLLGHALGPLLLGGVLAAGWWAGRRVLTPANA